MAIAYSKLTAQGRLSVPVEVRRKLGLKPGSIVEWVQTGVSIVVRRAGNFTSEDIHRAVFGSKKPAAQSIDQMKEGIRNYVRKRYARG